MATIHLPADFREFLRSLNAHKVEYLLIGGYGAGPYGQHQDLADLDELA